MTCALTLIYLGTLVATMPATALSQLVTIPGQVTALYGTLWHGRAVLDGGYALTWDHRPAALLRLRGAADLSLIGADTALTGYLYASPRGIGARDIAGRAGPGLLNLVPGLSLDGCTPRAVVDVAVVAMTRRTASAQGTLRADAGTCTETGGRVNAVPALDVALDTLGPDARARVTTGDTLLAQLTVRGDRVLDLTLQPQGAALIPGLPTGAPITLEYPF